MGSYYQKIFNFFLTSSLSSKQGGKQPLNDIIAIIILFLAYGLTLVLFIRSLKIVGIIDKENLRHLKEIQDKFKRVKLTKHPGKGTK